MDLQGRNLEIKMDGEDVKLLQKELRQIGYEIPKNEYDKSYFGKGTQKEVRRFQKEHNLQPTGVVDEKTAAVINKVLDQIMSKSDQFVVKGKVTYTDSDPAVGALVKAFDKDMRDEQELGEQKTDKNGSYEIYYLQKDFTRAEKNSADLWVKAFDSVGQVVAKSRILFNAKPEETIDLTIDKEIYRGPSEFELYVDELIRLKLDKQGAEVPFKDLKDEDVSFLAEETGINPEHIFYLKKANGYFDNTKVKPEIFYALFRDQSHSNLKRLLSLKLPQCELAVERSIERNIIPSLPKDAIQNNLKILKKLALETSFNETVEDGQPTIGNVIYASSLEPKLKERFLNLYLSHDASDKEFFEEILKNDPQLKKKQVQEDIKFTFQTFAIAGGHLPLLQALQQKRDEVKTFEDLIKFSGNDWLEIIKSKVDGKPVDFPPDTPGDTNAQKQKNYARTLSNNLEKTFPTKTFAYQMSKDERYKDSLTYKFLEKNRDFRLESTSVEEYFKNGNGDFANIPDKEKLKSELKSWQRLFKVIPENNKFRNAKLLMDEGYTSAVAMAGESPATFRSTLEGRISSLEIDEIVSAARLRTDISLGIYGRYGRPFHPFPLPVFPDYPEEVDGIPNWQEMFGTLNMCECEHCRSVYSPAAYLVDMLHFLNYGQIWDDRATERTPLKVLLERRPDIERIYLNCDNTNKLIPYIDLVNEILEEAISPSRPPAPTSSEDEIEVFLRNFQTNIDAEDELAEKRLLAEPQHENERAYGRLERDAVYPWALPFSLSLEKLKLFSAHLGIDVSEFVEILGGESIPDSLKARLRLGMTPRQWEIITTTDTSPTSLNNYWGIRSESGERLSDLVNIPVLFKKANLKYDGFVEITKTRFLNDDGTIKIEFNLEDTCDIDRANLRRDLSPEQLDRIHRFIRLQRHLGWRITELDKFLSFLEFRNINDEALFELSVFNRVRKNLRATVYELVSIYDPSEPSPSLLSNRLGKTGDEISQYAELIGIDPLAKPSDTLKFLNSFEILRKSNFSIQELRYLLLHKDQTPNVFIPIRDEVFEFLMGLREIIQDAINNPRPATSGTEAEEFYEDTIVENLAQKLGLDNDVTSVLLNNSLNGISHSTLSALEEIKLITKNDSDPTASEIDDFYKLFILLNKSALVMKKLQITNVELSVLSKLLSENSWIDFNSLPYEAPLVDHRVLVSSFENLILAINLKNSLPKADLNLFDLMDRARDDYEELIHETGFMELLHLNTAWDESYVSSIITRFGISYREAFRKIETYGKIARIVVLFKRLTVENPDELLAWITPTVTDDDLTEIFEFYAKSKYSEERWLEILRPLMDELREKKRDALLSYVIHDKSFEDSRDAYAHYLVDPEMDACMLTSRIKQANSSVQLFVQRCLMNLEREVELIPEGVSDRAREEYEKHWKQWKWMRYYRVWEANRKIFLYPENWIEPELRDNKSPFFVDLENELLQDEVTDENVEKAYRNYLEKLDEVARLDIRGLYHEEDRDILHVFGRTYSEPHIYFYRRRLADETWTGWEKIDLDIEGEHLLPVVHNGRLMLLWLIFNEKENDGKKYWEIKMAWSESKNATWIAKKVSSQSINTLYDLDSFAEKDKYYANIILKDGIYASVYRDIGGGYRKIFPGFFIDDCNSKINIIELRKFIEIISSFNYGWTTAQIRLPLNTHIEYSFFTEDREEPTDIDLFPLQLFTAALDETNNIVPRSHFNLLILNKTPGQFTLVYPIQFIEYVLQSPFLFSDEKRQYLVTPFKELPYSLPESFYIPGISTEERRSAMPSYFQFEAFYHPYVCEFIRRLNNNGLSYILDPQADDPLNRQLITEEEAFFATYVPVRGRVLEPFPKEEIDFSTEGAFSIYNWELFFHIPLLIANRLSKNNRFEEAQKWFHYIFDPTDVSDHPERARVWKFRPCFEEAHDQPKSIRELMRMLSEGDEELIIQVRAWRSNPFNPHLIARMRIIAYMMTVVMKYLDNLINWGDQLFTRDTIESINEATQLYILAAEIVGPRPKIIPKEETVIKNFEQVKSEELDEFSNVLVEIEGMIPSGIETPSEESTEEPRITLRMLYFCIPPNDKLLSYWDKIDHRLFKIRNCMNIEGQVRQLPLFEPPIDPALLVRAIAAGIDISQALSEFQSVSLPHYRYQHIIQRAYDFCGEVRSLGAALLSVLEKRDAEDLTLLRSRNEIELLNEVKQIKDQQINEAKETLESLKKAKGLAEKRLDYYSTRQFINTWETASITLTGISAVLQGVGQIMDASSGTSHSFPNFIAGGAGFSSPVALTMYGGSNVGSGLSSWAKAFYGLASLANTTASMTGTIGGYERRKDDWDFQVDLASIEIEQLDKQILAAEIRLAIAERDKENHLKQIEQSKEVDEFMRRKFTNRELYNWMVSQLSALHYQTYQMAYDLAKKVERACQHELGLEPSEFTFINFGQWDSLKKGLLAGEKLHKELRQMEVTYLEKNKREYEITKHLSLAMLDPISLLKLKETGECFVNIPEIVFDLDYPGHYMRKIKSLSITIPCVTGPYTGVNCTLMLQGNRIRKSTDTRTGYSWSGSTSDDRFIYNIGGIQSMATSSGQGDSGLFQLNFQDERYLPFEGSGVISNWRLELSGKWRNLSSGGLIEFPQFDFDTISDVIFHINYTARDGGAILKEAAVSALLDAINTMALGEDGERTGLFRIFSARHEFPNQWQKFQHPADSATSQALQLAMTSERFPFLFRGKTINVNKVALLLKLGGGFTSSDGAGIQFDLTLAGGTIPLELNPSDVFGGLLHDEQVLTSGLGDWSLRVTNIPSGLRSEDNPDLLNPNAIEDIFIVCHYSVSE